MVFAVVGADGNNWVKSPVPTNVNIDRISVLNENFVVLSAGTDATLLLYQDGSWKDFPGWSNYKASNTPFGSWANTERMYVSVVSENEVWIGSYASQGNNLHWYNNTFTAYPRGTSRRVRSMDAFGRGTEGSTLVTGMTYVGGSSANSMVASMRFRYSDSTRINNNIQVHDENGPTITSVSAFSESNIWAAGGGYLYRSTNHGNSYIEYERPNYATGNVNAVYAFNDTSAVAGTADGYLFLWTEDNGFGDNYLWDFDFVINAIYAVDASNIWVAGNNGNLWYFDGATAHQIDLGIGSHLVSIDGSGVNNIWVAGTGGQVWSTIPEPSHFMFAPIVLLGVLWLRKRR